MVIAFRSAGPRAQVTTTPISLTLPTGLAQDDLLFAHVAHGASTAIPTPSGWNYGFDLTAAASTHRWYMFWKFAGSGESSPSFATTSTSTAGAWGATSCFSGVPIRANPFLVAPTASNGSGVTLTGAAMTNTVANAMAVWMWTQYDNGLTSTVTNSATIMYNGTNYDSIVGIDANISAACKLITATGSTSTTNETSASGAVWGNMRFILDPTPVAASEITGDFFLMGF